MGHRQIQYLGVYLLMGLLLAACTSKQSPQGKQPAEKQETAAPVATVVRFATPDGQTQKPARYQQKGKSTWQPLETGALNPGDTIASSPETTGLIQLNCANKLALGPDTSVTAGTCNSVTLNGGEVWIMRRDAAGKTALTVETKVAKAQLSDGIGSIRFNGQLLEISLVTGRAEIKHANGRLTLGPGEAAEITEQHAKRIYIKDPGGLVAWTEGLRTAIAEETGESTAPRLNRPPGLGTLSAHLPGSKAPLPFHSLGQDIDIHIQDHMALTRVEQVFENPSARVVEGTYKFLLPEGAKLTGYDMEINGEMMRGEIVTRKQGRAIMKRVIREFLDRMRPRDPALVEWESGSTFTTRIFPIKSHEKKRIVLSYIHPLPGSGGRLRYQLPLSCGAEEIPEIPKFRVKAVVSAAGGAPDIRTPLYPATIDATPEATTVAFEAARFRPRADFVIEIDHTPVQEATLSTYGRRAALPSPTWTSPWGTGVSTGEDAYFMLRITPTIDAYTAASATDWIVVVDNSESRFGMEKRVETHLATTLVDAMGAGDRIKVIRFDTFPETMEDEWASPSPELTRQVSTFLNALEPGGASNIEAALREAVNQCATDRPLNIVLISDGVPTVGETLPGPLGEWAASLVNEKSISLSAVGVGASVDQLLLRALARAAKGSYFHVSSGEDLYAAAVRIVTGLRGASVERPTLGFDGLEVRDVLPRSLPNIPPGGSIVVTGKVRGKGALAVSLQGTLSGKPWQHTYSFDVTAPKPANTFIPLFHAANQVDAFTLDGAETAAASVSKKFGIASRYTSFIVLENEAMYRKFKVKKDGERLTWNGDQEIEYEILEEMEQEESADESGEFDEIKEDKDNAPLSGLATRSSAGAPVRSAKRAKAKTSSPMKSSAPSFDSLLGSTNDYAYYSYSPPRPVFRARIWRPAAPAAKEMETASRLEVAVEGDPMNRKHRRELVKHLLRYHLLERATVAVTEWLALDRSNPEPHRHAAELMKMQGNMRAAFRHLGSIIDLKPESKEILSAMAGYFEAHGVWQRSYPFRSALSALAPKDANATARRAISAALAGADAEAKRVSLMLSAVQSNGYHRLKPGIRLSKHLKSAVLAIADMDKLPLNFNPLGEQPRQGKITIALEADPRFGLELWVSQGRDRFLGGMDDRGYLETNQKDDGKIRLIVPAGDPGIYRVQVLCSNPEGCDNASGKVTIKAHSTRRTIPFRVDKSQGLDIAVLRVRKLHFKW